MTKRELNEMLSQNGGEIVFEDGYSIAAFTGSYYCTYSPDQHVGQGIVCNFEKAVKFYFEHCYASHKAGPFQTEKELEQFFNKPGRKITFNNGSSIERVSENRYILFTLEMWEDGRLIPARCPIAGIDVSYFCLYPLR